MLLLAHHYSIISHINVFYAHTIATSTGNPFMCHKTTPFHYQKEVGFGHWAWDTNWQPTISRWPVFGASIFTIKRNPHEVWGRVFEFGFEHQKLPSD